MCSQARHQRTKMTEQERRLMERYTQDTSLRLSRHVHCVHVQHPPNICLPFWLYWTIENRVIPKPTLYRVTGPSSVPSSLSSSSSSSSWSQRSRKGRDRSNLLEPLDKENAGVTGRFSKSSENVRNRRNGDYRNDKNNSSVIQRRYQSHSPNKTVKVCFLFISNRVFNFLTLLDKLKSKKLRIQTSKGEFTREKEI